MWLQAMTGKTICSASIDKLQAAAIMLRINDLYQFVILMIVAILYCSPQGARGSFGEGTPSKITQ